MMRMMKKADRKDQSTARTARVSPDTTIPIRHIRYITVSIAGIFYTGKKCLYTIYVNRCSVAWPEVNKSLPCRVALLNLTNALKKLHCKIFAVHQILTDVTGELNKY